MNGKIVGTALLLSLLSAAALAQSAPSPERAEAREKVRTACAADIQRFCTNIERTTGAMRSCLEQHQTGLSQECNAARTERVALRAKEKG